MDDALVALRRGSRGWCRTCRSRPRAHERALQRARGSLREHPRLRALRAARRAPASTTSGITSPALRTMTVSPGRTSFGRTWSSLCSVASPTVEPPTNTGSSIANGVAFPVRPIDTMMSLQHRRALLGRELVGDRPSRRLGSSRRAPRVARDRRPSRRRRRSRRASRGGGPASDCSTRSTASSVSSVRISGFTGKPSSRSVLERLVVARERRTALHLAELVTPHRQLAAGGDRRVLLAQRARRGVAGVGEQARAGFGLALVQRLERGDRHVHLAPHLEHLRRALRQPLRARASIVRTFAVTSSPTRPSPRVAACTRRPFS